MNKTFLVEQVALEAGHLASYAWRHPQSERIVLKDVILPLLNRASCLLGDGERAPSGTYSCADCPRQVRVY